MSTKRWIGNAPAVADLWTVTLSGSVISQTYTMTINGKSVTYVAGGADTVAVILAALVAAWNASDIPEMQELAAAVASASTLTLTGNDPGVPSTITVATGGGATFTRTNTTAATGPNDFANALNWSTGTAPANSDVLVFDNGNVDCLYNLSTVLTGIVLLVDQGFSGKIGLPFVNVNGSVSYAEYRTTSLTLAGGTATINSAAIQRCNLAFGANTTTVRILNTGQRENAFVPTVLIIGGNGSSELDITKGDVGVAFYAGTTATFPIVKTGYLNNANSDVNVTFGSGATLTTVTKNGGAMTVNSDVTTLVQDAAGGVLTIAAGVVTTLEVDGGTCYPNTTGTLATVTISNDATLNFDQDPRAKTITNPILVYGDKANVLDNQKVVNSGVLSVTANQTTAINVQHGSNNVMTFT